MFCYERVNDDRQAARVKVTDMAAVPPTCSLACPKVARRCDSNYGLWNSGLCEVSPSYCYTADVQQ